MKKYYYISWPNDNSIGVGYAPDNVDMFLIQENTVIDSWTPIIFKLKNGNFADYQAVNLGWNVFSEKLKTIIENNCDGEEAIEWLEIYIISENKEKRKYFVSHLPNRQAILNDTKTKYSSGGILIKPVIDSEKAKNLQFFSYNEGENTIFVSEKIKKAIQKEKMTGIVFEKAAST